MFHPEIEMKSIIFISKNEMKACAFNVRKEKKSMHSTATINNKSCNSYTIRSIKSMGKK